MDEQDCGKSVQRNQSTLARKTTAEEGNGRTRLKTLNVHFCKIVCLYLLHIQGVDQS